jgi:hypothetical protein
MLKRKTRSALEALIRRARADAINGGRTPFAVAGCRAVLDRMHVTADEFPRAEIVSGAGYRVTRSHRIKAMQPDRWYPYRRVTVLRSRIQETELAVLSERRKPWLPPFRLEFRGTDSAGVRLRDVAPVLQFLGANRLTLVELAVDFALSTGVDENVVRRHARFGKSRQGTDQRWSTRQTWGSRKGGKFIRTYFKPEIAAHRVELQLGGKLLRRLRIRDIFDFRQLAEAIPAGLIQFVGIDHAALERRLRRRYRVEEVALVLAFVAARDTDLADALRYLRKKAKLSNVHRLLRPMRNLDELVRGAVMQWAAEWPQKPVPLRGKESTKSQKTKEIKK